MSTEGVLGVALINAATATGLALAVAMAARFVRRPGLVHGLWVVVLLDLLTPPIVEIGVLPAPTVASVPLDAASTLATSGAGTGSPTPLPGGADGSMASWLLAAWLVGSALVLLLTLWRGVRFERWLAGAVDAPPALQQRAAWLARAFGLKRCPRVRLVPARVSPMLWFRPGRLDIVFPEELLRRLGTGERDALLGHELAHVRRRDHWTRWLELAASSLFWWHPVVWLARAALRRAEERSCDAWVRLVLPAHARDYARGLVKAVEFLSMPRRRIPALASGLGPFRRLEERVTMILDSRPPTLTTRPQRLVLALLGAALLLVFPTAAQRPLASGDGRDGGTAARSGQPTEQDRGLDEEAAALHQQIRDLELRRMALLERLEEVQRRRSVERPHDEAVRADVDRLLARELELQREGTALSEGRRGAALERSTLEQEARRLARQAEVLAGQGYVDSARELERRAQELAAATRRAERREVRRSVEAEIAAIQAELERLAGTPQDAEVRAQVDELRRAMGKLERELMRSRSDAREPEESQ